MLNVIPYTSVVFCNATNSSLTAIEPEQFLGTLLHMSLFTLPSSGMFWNKATRVTQVDDIFSLNRW